MNENLNLIEILKDCPKGTKLYSTIFGEVELNYVVNGGEYPIKVLLKGDTDSFTEDGRILSEYEGECVLFPSKEQRDWSKFKVKKPEFKPKKAKFDPKTLKPFDKVLGFFNGVWNCDLYSHYYNDDRMFPYVCFRSCVNRVIPYNDDTKHLVGTPDDAPELYRYWED